MADLAVGLDLGGTMIKAALVTATGEIVGKTSIPTDAAAGPEAIADQMAAAVDTLLSETGAERSRIAAAGIGAPGPMNWQTGVVFSPPNLAGWKDVPLADLMRERLGVPCFVDNDANIACYGEFWLGAGKGVESMCLLTLGTGVGGGIVLFGRLLRGIDGTAAEIGHLTVHRDGRLCGCGAKGCLEAYGSVSGMVRTAVEGLEAGRESALRESCGEDFSTITGKMISEAAANGDEFAQWVVQETGEWLGVGIASLINLLNPEKVVLGGGMINAGSLLLDTIRERARSDAFDVPAARAEIVTATLGEDAGVVGGAGVAFERLSDEA